MKPLVAMSAQTETDPQSYAIRIRYVDYLVHAGAMAVVIPPNRETEDLAATLDRCDGLFVGGGPDIWPELYGAPKPADATPYHRFRDESELALIRHAFEVNMPVFAVCRGMQVMNVALGGTLYEDIHVYDRGIHWLADDNEDPIFPAHDVEVTHDGPLENVLGAATIPVNSMHHQAISRMATGLKASAFGPSVNMPDEDETAIIEAVYHPERDFFVGVQWHPEYCPTDEPSIRLAQSFVRACENYHMTRKQGDEL